MKQNDETATDRLAWANVFCARLERSAKLFEYWDFAISESKGQWVYAVVWRWGCSREQMIKKRQEAFDNFLGKD